MLSCRKFWMTSIGLLGLLAVPVVAQPAYSDSQDFGLDSQLFEWSPSFFDSLDFLLDTQLVGASLSSSDSNSFNANFTRVNRVWADSEEITLDIAPTGSWLDVTPSPGIAFGSVPVNGSATLAFVVTNSGGSTLTGNASVSAPFSIISGGTYNLGPGIQQSVTIRYSPIAEGSHVRPVLFSGPSQSITREVSGTTLAATPEFGVLSGIVSGSTGSPSGNSFQVQSTTSPVRGALIQPLSRTTGKPIGPWAICDDTGYSLSLPSGPCDVLVIPLHPIVDLFKQIRINSVDIPAGTTTTLNVILQPKATPTPSKPPVVLVRGWGADEDWNPFYDTVGEGSYWRDLRNRLEGDGFEVWECNRPEGLYNPTDQREGHFIDGEIGITLNANNLDSYIFQKIEEYKSTHNEQAPEYLSIVAHSTGGLVVRQFMHTWGHKAPPISTVVMLGTPNAGTIVADGWYSSDACNEQLCLPMFVWESTKELRIENIRNQFNKSYRWTHSNTLLYLLAGTNSNLSSDGPIRSLQYSLLDRNYLRDLSPEGDKINDGLITKLSVSGQFMYPPFDTFANPPNTAYDANLNHSQLTSNSSVTAWIVNALNAERGTIVPYSVSQSAVAAATFEVGQTIPIQQIELRSGIIEASDILDYVIPCDAASHFMVAANWQAPGFSISLVDPFGTAVSPSDSSDEPPSAIFEITNPTPGNWRVLLAAPGEPAQGAAYRLYASGDADLALNPETAAHFASGQQPIISCSLLNGPQFPVVEMTVQATIIKPDNALFSMPLFDDGAHVDGAVNDGVYSALLPEFSQAGEYRVTYRTEGTGPSGVAFRRVATSTFNISPSSGFIAGNLADDAIDVDGDGQPDLIRLQLWLTANAPGTFVISGDLLANSGEVIGASQIASKDIAGTWLVSLYFDRKSITQPGTYGPFTVENLQLFEQTDAQTIWQDKYGGSYAVQTQLVVPASPLITAWRSVRTHGTAGELAIVLNASASGNGSGGPTVETRNGGIRKIEVDFDGTITLVNPAGVGVFGQSTVGGVMQGVIDYSGAAAVSLLDSDTLQLVFAAGALPDETCYTLVVSPTAITGNLSGDTDCLIRSLIADLNGSGTISISDQLSAKSKLNTVVQDSPKHDLNLSGTITISDQLLARSRVTSPTKTALCP